MIFLFGQKFCFFFFCFFFLFFWGGGGGRPHSHPQSLSSCLPRRAGQLTADRAVCFRSCPKSNQKVPSALSRTEFDRSLATCVWVRVSISSDSWLKIAPPNGKLQMGLSVLCLCRIWLYVHSNLYLEMNPSLEEVRKPCERPHIHRVTFPAGVRTPTEQRDGSPEGGLSLSLSLSSLLSLSLSLAPSLPATDRHSTVRRSLPSTPPECSVPSYTFGGIPAGFAACVCVCVCVCVVFVGPGAVKKLACCQNKSEDDWSITYEGTGWPMFVQHYEKYNLLCVCLTVCPA